MKLPEKIDRVFSSRSKPAQLRIADAVRQLDSDVEDALWFSGRDWHELTWGDWQQHSSAVYFFDRESFAYYLPSILTLSAQNPSDALLPAESLIDDLDCSPDPEVWTEGVGKSIPWSNPG